MATNLPTYVWIAPPNARTVNGETVYSFEWQDNPAWWQRSKRLIARKITTALKGQGQAIFDMRSGTFREAGRWSDTDDAVAIIPGAYICVTEGGDANALQPDNAVFWGYIVDVAHTVVKGNATSPGQVMAMSIGHLWEQTDVTGWAWANTASDNYGQSVMSPPTANFRSTAGTIIGNAVGIQDSGVAGGGTVYVFARRAQDCGTAAGDYFTRWRLLQHLLAYCIYGNGQYQGPVDWPPVSITITSEVSALLNDTTRPDVFQLDGMTYSQIVDLCIPQTLGLTWHLDVAYDSTQQVLTWDMRVISTTTTSPDPTHHPDAKATAVDVDSDDAAALRHLALATTSLLHYDEVRVRGARALFGITVGSTDYNLDKGWTFDQQDTYADGAGAGAPQSEHDARRAQPDVADVGVRYIIESPTGYDVRTQTEPITGSADLSTGDGYGGGVIPAVPQLRYDETKILAGSEDQCYDLSGTGSTVFCSQSVSRAPYMPTARVAVDLPWPVGVDPDGLTDERSDAAKAAPQWAKPKVYLYDSSDDAWTDLLADDANETPRVSAAGLGLAVRVRYRAQSYLLADWQTAGGGAQDYEGSLALSENWEEMVLTIAVESDQVIEVKKTRTDGIGAVRNRLLIERPDLGVWVMRQGAVLGLDDAETPIRPTVSGTSRDIVVRNDWPTLQRLADQVAAYVFMDRNQATLELKITDAVPSWATIGTLIGTIDDDGVTHTVNTIVASVAMIYDGEPKRVITTDIPALPEALLKAASDAPAQGGAISLATGATTFQEARRARADAHTLQDDQRDRLVHEPRSAPAAPEYLAYLIDGDDSLYSSGSYTVEGIADTPGSEPTSVPSATPSTPYPANLGRARIWGDPPVNVWVATRVEVDSEVITDGIGDVAAQAGNNNSMCRCRRYVDLPIGAGPDTARVYILEAEL